MTPNELYAKGYSIEWTPWGVALFRTVDGSPGSSAAEVAIVVTIQFGRPLAEADARARGWEAAETDFVKRRLS